MIQNPIGNSADNYFKNIYNLEQLKNIFDHVEGIIDNFDDLALQEFFSGNEDDVDKLLEILLLETRDVLYFQKGKIKLDTFDYLQRVTDTFDEELKIRSFNYFVVSSLPDFEVNLHHLEWGNLIMLYLQLGILAARDHSKSFTFSKAYPIWKLYRYRKHNPSLPPKINNLNKEGMLITNEYSLAEQFMKGIKEEIENNGLLRDKLYPEKGEGWGKGEITCKTGAFLQVKGSGSALRGRHPGWIVVDDYLDESQLYSKEQREKAIDAFHSIIMNMIVPGGQVIVVGTPFHEGDLYKNLKEARGWRVFEYPAIFPDGKVLWPNRYGIKELLNKREDIGSIRFSREILTKPISSDSSIFPYAILKNAFLGMDSYTLVNNKYSFPKQFKKIGVGCDFAISSNVGADYTVFTVMGIDEYSNFWLLYQWRKRGASYNEQIAKLKYIKQNFEPDVIMAEDNVFQKVMIDIANDNGLKVVNHTTGINKYDLSAGLPALAVLFEQGRIKFPRGDQYSKDVTDTICNEAAGVTWTDKGKLENTMDHDDTLMSIWITIRSLKYVHGKMKVTLI